jgi:hypothetical protein
MKTPATLDRAVELNATVAACLLVKPAGSAMVETVHRGLLAAGMRVLSVPTVYDAVVEADRMVRPSSAGPVGLRHFIVGIDFFGQQELRLFPLVRREWPQTLLVAYHSPGFDYKGRLAELLGADVILGSDEDVARFAESLVMPAAPPDAAASKPEPASAAPAPAMEKEEAAPAPLAEELPPAAPPTTLRATAPVAPPTAQHATAPAIPPASPMAAVIAVLVDPVPPPSPAAPAAEVKPELPVAVAAPPPHAPADEMPLPSPAKSSGTALAALAAVVSSMPLAGPYVSATSAPGAAPTNGTANPRQAAGQPPAGATAEGLATNDHVIGDIELTEEELRLLLGEEDEA